MPRKSMRVVNAKTEPSIDEADIVRRALSPRRRRKIATLWAEGGKYWISDSDPHAGERTRITLANLKILVEQLEAELIKKPMGREQESNEQGVPEMSGGVLNRG